MNYAFSTLESPLVAMSNREQRHPVFGTPSFESTFDIPLINGQRRSIQEALEMTQGRLERPVEIGIRSAVAQAGIDAGYPHPRCTEISLPSKNVVRVTTLLTDVRQESDGRVLHTISSLADTGRIQLLCLMHLPHEAKRYEVRAPLMPGQTFRINWENIGDDELRKALEGKISARELIHRAAVKIRDPRLLKPGSFYLGKIWNPPMDGCLGVLRRAVETEDGKETDATQLGAIRFDRDRSCGVPRAVEIDILDGGKPLAFNDAYCRVDRYAIDDNAFDGTRRLP